MSDPSRPAIEPPALVVEDVPARQRYEATTAGDAPALAGLIDYQHVAGSLALVHTEVLEDFAGQGVGSRLVRDVIADARERGLRVVPHCPFVVRWLEKHPDQQDVLAQPLAGSGGTRPLHTA